jgi:hypothetical protein
VRQSALLLQAQVLEGRQRKVTCIVSGIREDTFSARNSIVDPLYSCGGSEGHACSGFKLLFLCK